MIKRTTSAAEVGAWLRDQRVALNRSLEDVSRGTCVPVGYLRAVEEGDFQSLPDELYARSHVRQYARFLGIDIGNVLEIFPWSTARSRVAKWNATPDGSWGAWISRERRTLQVSLEEIASATHIPSPYLKALEQDRFELVPDGLFTRSYIRQYADYLGLDSGRVLGLFDDSADPSGVDVALVLGAEVVSEEAERHQSRGAFGSSRAVRLGLRTAMRLFSVVEALVPPRIRNEELGDALEAMTEPGRSATWIWTKLLSTLFWITANALRELRAAGVTNASNTSSP